MSGADAFARSPQPKAGPIEAKLALEDTRPLVRAVGAGQTLGLGFIAWALSVQVTIPREFFVPPDPRPGPLGPVIVLPEYPAAKRTKAAPPVSKRRKEVKPAPLSATRKPPEKAPGLLGQSVLTSRGDKAGLLAYDLLDKAMKHIDEDKLAITEGLTRTSPTRLDGRRGRVAEAFNEAYHMGGTEDGTGDGLLPAAPAGERISSTLRTAGDPSGAPVSVDMAKEGLSRSTASILAVVRAHSPGLRHLYNTHLKRNPGLGGKVTVRFAISPGGRVVDAAVASSTTGSREFDAEVVARILAWRFEPVKAFGNDLVTVPFNFSE